MNRYQCFDSQDVSLEYLVRGSGGEPVVFIHGSMIADSNAPLFEQPSLECHALMSYLEVSSAHIVGHSQGGVIALQLALDYPACVYSLSLLEPALVGYISQAAAIQKKFLPIMQMYKKGDKKGAIDQMLQIVSGKSYRPIIEKILPNLFDQAVIDADGLFKIDMPAMQLWRDKQDDVKSIDKPILCVLGSDSEPMFRETCRLVLSWLPESEMLVIPNATHWLQLTNPKSLAEGLASFFSKHAIK